MTTSTYERRLGWLDRLRRRLRVEPDDEIAVNDDGVPTFVVINGELAGVRSTSGALIPIPEEEPRLEDLFDDATEWVWGPNGWRQRWRR